MGEENTGNHHMRLLKGIIKPKKQFEGLDKAEQIAGIGWRLVLLAVINAVLGAALAYVTIHLFNVPEWQLEQFKQAGISISADTILLAGVVFGGISGFILTLVIPTVASLIYWPFFREVGFKKLFAIHLYAALINIIASAVHLALLPVFTFQAFSYVSLGAFTQFLTDSTFVNVFFGGITIFFIWKLYVVITAVQNASNKTSAHVASVFIILNWLLLMVSATLASIDISQFNQIR